MSRRSNRSQYEWEKLVKEWKASGTRITPWSKKHGVPINTMRYWRDRLTFIDKNSFVELKEPVQIKEVSTQSTSASGVYLFYNNIQIQLEKNFDVSVLEKCINLLKGLPC